ncbi:AAA family ATPase [Clostridium nigeriense]|uniref:AAA family ATPase n=1 Tax=Clostridium nigeriense TaxID=1805470 RepID=UPI003D35053A
MSIYREIAEKMLMELNQVILGKESFIFEVVSAVLANGHILLEDIPGVGKTTLALSVSKLMGLKWNRVQFTPDVLPSDLTGFSIYRRETEKFVYQPGAVFCNLLLADEINRTSPKTQSALLEVMEEMQVTVDGNTREVPSPFLVIATQNPLGTSGTQPLPSAQMDRFLVCITMGYPDFKSEVIMAKELDAGKRTEKLAPIANAELLLKMQKEVEKVYVHDSIYEYIVRLITATRECEYFNVGVSPRGTIALVKISRATAWLNGNDFVSPSDVYNQFTAIARHRVQISAKARIDGIDKEEILEGILRNTDMPSFKRK